jgi:transposase
MIIYGTVALNGDHYSGDCMRELQQARAHIVELERERDALQQELEEALKLVELQKADIDRYRRAYESITPNCPERVPKAQLQLAFERVVSDHGKGLDLPKEQPDTQTSPTTADVTGSDPKEPKRKRRHRHGRRRLDTTSLPLQRIEQDPDEVLQAKGEGYRLIGEEVSERVAYQRAGYVRLQFVRRKWVAADATKKHSSGPTPKSNSAVSVLPKVMVAPLPPWMWPGHMADASAVANVIVSKYGDCLPLNRQETISERDGFILPRSTQCSWLTTAYDLLYRIDEAMFAEAKAKAVCMATDATGAPVKSTGQCVRWHVFVFVADADHVVFRYSESHTSKAIASMLAGYSGYVLADAAKIHDTLFADGSRQEVGCWYHQRRYLWRALQTEPQQATEGLSIIAKLFAVARQCADEPMPDRTELRAARAGPILELFDRWIDSQRDVVDPRGRLDAAITYYDNQREALRRFLRDGRLPLDNGVSERALRNLVLGRHNWLYFANETGLRWYVTFRSLIASCALHGLNAQHYFEQVLRLAPHWPVTRMLELAPKYFARTLEQLDPQYQQALLRPWDVRSRIVDLDADRGAVSRAA